MNNNVKTALIIGGIIVVLLVVLPLVLGPGWGGSGGWGMMGPGMMGGFGVMGLFGPLFMVVFWGLVIWGVVALIRGTTGSSGGDSYSGRTDSAVEVLKRRYARGEMSKEEFEEKKKDLV